jgi:hypothetical protein
MTQPYIVAVEGLDTGDGLEDIAGAVAVAAYRAINKTVDHARAVASREIREQINFPARYLTELDGQGQPRLGVTSRASVGNLAAVLAARDRPTSLARFVVGSTAPAARQRQGGVKVKVKDTTKTIGRAFIFQLRSGNKGLAVRTAGGPPTGAWKPLPIGKNLFLLFGPSVNQVFGGDRGVAQDIAPSMADRLEDEFHRLLKLDL